MLRGLPGWNAIIALGFLPLVPVWAHDASKEYCSRALVGNKPVTLRAMTELAMQRVEVIERNIPKPAFDNIEDAAKFEQVPDREVPLAMQTVLGNDVGFVSTPAPTSPHPATVNLTNESASFPVHVDTNFRGRKVSTAAYVALPRNKIQTPGSYLISNDYPVVVVHLHGGGTPTATGKNAMSIGEKLASAGIPTLALDLPGHGRATRNPEGLESMEAQIDLLLQQIDQLVHPGVKIVLSGHSWGGMFAAHMWRNSRDPKYHRIARFISLSPGIDVSLGGDNAKKLEFDRWWELHFQEFEDRIAPADFEFQENMLANGKDSDVGGIFTSLSDFDYITPPLKPGDQDGLKPITVVVGEADGVVYVGRERQFAAAFGALEKPSQFLLLGPGRTWKSKSAEDLQPTGHNIFDRYIDGTNVLQVYALLTDTAMEVAGGALPPPSEPDSVQSLLDWTFRNYANFIAFRELVASDVEFVETNSPDLQKLSGRKVELDEYIRRVDQQQRENGKEIDAQVSQAVEALRAELGLKDINLRRAQEELAAPPLTDERRRELETFIERVQTLDRTLRDEFTDVHFEREVEALGGEFAPLLTSLGLSRLEDYKPALDEFAKRRQKDLSREEVKVKGDLSRLHQKYSALLAEKRGRFGLERERRLSEIPHPSGLMDARAAERELTSDRSEDRRARLASFVERYAETERRAREAAEERAARRLAELARPEGVESQEDGRRARERQDSMLDMTFAPGIKVIDRLAERISELAALRERAMKGSGDGDALDRLAVELEKIRVRRAGLLARWESLWKAGAITSPALSYEFAEYERTYAAYRDLYHAYSARADWLRGLSESGRLTGANILAGTSELKVLRHRYQHARQMFTAARQQLEDVKWAEALSGRLTAKDGADTGRAAAAIAEAVKIAQEIWGNELAATGKPALNSLTAQLKTKEEYLETRRRQVSLLEHELSDLRHQYSREMRAAGLPVPYIVERVAVYELLNRPIKDLLPLLRQNPVFVRALSQLKARWEPLLSELRRISQSKDGVGY